MHSNNISCSKNSSPLGSSFLQVIASDLHLEPESENRVKNVNFHTAKHVSKEATLFLYF